LEKKRAVFTWGEEASPINRKKGPKKTSFGGVPEKKDPLFLPGREGGRRAADPDEIERSGGGKKKVSPKHESAPSFLGGRGLFHPTTFVRRGDVTHGRDYWKKRPPALGGRGRGGSCHTLDESKELFWFSGVRSRAINSLKGAAPSGEENYLPPGGGAPQGGEGDKMERNGCTFILTKKWESKQQHLSMEESASYLFIKKK